MDMESSSSSDNPAGAGTAAGVTKKPPPKDMSHHYSEVTKARTANKMKQYYKYFMIPGIGQLAGGLPNPSYFPFDTLEAQTAKPDRWEPRSNDERQPVETEQLASQLAQKAAISKAAAAEADPAAAKQQKKKREAKKRPASASHVVVPHDSATEDPFERIDLATALQYGQANGYPPLLSFVRQFTRECLHPNVPYDGGPEIIFTVGATDGLSKALQLFVNDWIPGKDDPRDRPGLLTEVFMYTNVLSQAEPHGVKIAPVEMDEDGMLPYGPGGLEDVLSNWDETKGKRPHLMYTVTMGHNPTGGVLPLERRKQIYALCSKYDVIIIEDDPYWYLQYPSAAAEEARSRGQPPPLEEEPSVNTLERKSGYAFLDSLVPSYLSIDVDGRVVRLDTFSKTVAPGCRMGWMTATPAIIERLLRINESSTQQPSGFVQVVVASALMGSQPESARAGFAAALRLGSRDTFAGWRVDGWVRWLEGLRAEYERRMVAMCRALDDGAHDLKHQTPLRAADADWGVITKTRLYDLRWPRGGMFVWLRMRFESHPLWGAPRQDTNTSTGTGAVVDGVALCTALFVLLTRKPHLVVVSPGLMFSATEEIAAARGWAHYRLCFAAEDDADEVAACSRRFAEGVRRFWRIKRVAELERLLEGAPGSEEQEAALLDDFVPAACVGC